MTPNAIISSVMHKRQPPPTYVRSQRVHPPAYMGITLRIPLPLRKFSPRRTSIHNSPSLRPNRQHPSPTSNTHSSSTNSRPEPLSRRRQFAGEPCPDRRAGAPKAPLRQRDASPRADRDEGLRCCWMLLCELVGVVGQIGGGRMLSRPGRVHYLGCGPGGGMLGGEGVVSARAEDGTGVLSGLVSPGFR